MLKCIATSWQKAQLSWINPASSCAASSLPALRLATHKKEIKDSSRFHFRAPQVSQGTFFRIAAFCLSVSMVRRAIISHVVWLNSHSCAEWEREKYCEMQQLCECCARNKREEEEIILILIFCASLRERRWRRRACNMNVLKWARSNNKMCARSQPVPSATRIRQTGGLQYLRLRLESWTFRLLLHQPNSRRLHFNSIFCCSLSPSRPNNSHAKTTSTREKEKLKVFHAVEWCFGAFAAFLFLPRERDFN